MYRKISLGATVVAIAAYLLAGQAARYIENYEDLHLPAPSFKRIGPKVEPYIPKEEKGVYETNDFLHKAKRLFKGIILGSESVAVDHSGHLYMLDRYGVVQRTTDGKTLERIAHLGAGRPLGFHFDSHENLIICNAATGLQMLEKDTKKIILLASEAPVSGEPNAKLTPIRYANDLAIASDGSIYFSDATETPPAINALGFYDTMQSFMLSIIQGGSSGRILKYDPSTRKTSFVAGGFFFANGVALSKDESFLLAADTTKGKLHKIWLQGPKAGERELWFDDLPGYPDGITSGKDGSFWISLVSMSQPVLEKNLKSRWLGPMLPASWKKLEPGTAVVQITEEKKVLRYLVDRDGSHLNTMPAITETEDGLYLGNLGGDYVSFLSKADLPPPHL